MGVGVGVAGTHITRYLLENVLEVLLLFSFLVRVARPWLWKHKAKLAHRGGGWTDPEESLLARRSQGAYNSPRGSRSCVRAMLLPGQTS